MTSTSPNSRSTSPQQTKLVEGFLQKVLQLPGIRRLQFQSIGTQLFISVMGGALIGIGGIGLLFGEIVKLQTEEEIQQTLSDKAHIIEDTIAQAELVANTLRTSILTLHDRGAKTPETYQQLTFELFADHPTSVTGLGFGQSQNGVLPDQAWFFSSFHVDSETPDAQIRFADGTESGKAYSESDRYKNYFLPQKDVWSQPYQSGDQIQSTYYSQIFDDRGTWLGTAFVDIDSTSFNQVLGDSVLHQAGHFALLTKTGQVVSYPTAPELENPSATYQSIPGLEAIWSQMKVGESGLIEGEKGYWAYAQIADSDWIALAFVPYHAIFNRVALITVGGTLTVGLLLALTLSLTLRSITRRLRPILETYPQFAITDEPARTPSKQQDEIAQISATFFHLQEQVNDLQGQIQQEANRTDQVEMRLQQAEATERESQALREEIEYLLRVLAAIEKGDLTLEAQQNPQMTGHTIDSLNHLIGRLGQLISLVLTTSQQVTQSAEDLEHWAVTVIDYVQQQTHSAIQVEQLMEGVNELTLTIESQIFETNNAVELTQEAIIQGQEEANVMTQGMTELQQEMGQIIKRTQTLTNYMDLATEFAKDQKRIAAMTRILAVNASMLASRASAQQDPEQLAVITSEFQTIAAQVNQLATQTNQSLVSLQQRTDQIQTVVSGLNYDVQEMNQKVNHLSSSVHQSRKAFSAVIVINERMSSLGQHISQFSQTIADAAQTTIQTVRKISAIAAETGNQANLTKEEARQMERFARTLFHSAEFFRLKSNAHPALAIESSLSPSGTTPETIASSQNEDPAPCPD